ncbi:MAG: nicotinate phosphoribosyltransferase, partial [Thermoproteota archaeon]
YAMPDGSIFRPGVPVMRVEGPYSEMGALETTFLGFLCSLSGVATAAARVKLAAGGKPVVNFGIRRAHPAISLAIERASIIGGVDGSSGILVEEIGLKPVGTMPHALIIIFGDQVEAWRAFDEVLPEEVPRIALVDTFSDEKTESLMAAEALGERLTGVRLDTPGSRRGRMEDIVREVRWELDLRGYRHVKIFVSGGLNEESVRRLSEAGADAFGVGTYICGAKPVDFGADVVEVDGVPRAKRGIMSGAKDVYVCERDLEFAVVPRGAEEPACPRCGGPMKRALVKMIEGGRRIYPERPLEEIRREVLKRLEILRKSA